MLCSMVIVNRRASRGHQTSQIMQNLPGKKPNLPIAILLVAVLLAGLLLYGQYGRAQPSVKIGVLHSLSGTMAASEAPLVDAIRLAVEEINRSGGLNGRPVEMIVADCRSDDAYCGRVPKISRNSMFPPR